MRFADVNVTLRTLGGPAILLIWLYVMANVIIFGGEVNWWWRRASRESSLEAANERLERRCECSAFQSSPSSATVRSSPSGTKTGS